MSKNRIDSLRQKGKRKTLTLDADQLQRLREEISALYLTAWFIESAVNTVLSETIGEGAPSTDSLSVYSETMLNFVLDSSHQQMTALEKIEAIIGIVPANAESMRLGLTMKPVSRNQGEGRSNE